MTGRSDSPAPAASSLPADSPAPVGPTGAGDDGATGCPHRAGSPPWLLDGTVPGEPTALVIGHGGGRLDRLGRWFGHARWVEQRLFEVVGGWSGTEQCPDVSALCSVVAQQAARHAEGFADRLPVLATVDPDQLTVPPPGWSGALEALAASTGTRPEDGPALAQQQAALAAELPPTATW
jgi:hypothetical protein